MIHVLVIMQAIVFNRVTALIGKIWVENQYFVFGAGIH